MPATIEPGTARGWPEEPAMVERRLLDLDAGTLPGLGIEGDDQAGIGAEKGPSVGGAESGLDIFEAFRLPAVRLAIGEPVFNGTRTHTEEDDAGTNKLEVARPFGHLNGPVLAGIALINEQQPVGAVVDDKETVLDGRRIHCGRSILRQRSRCTGASEKKDGEAARE